MIKQIKFEKLPLPKTKKYYWFSAEHFEDGILKKGEGCHSSDKTKMNEIIKKFESLVKGE